VYKPVLHNEQEVMIGLAIGDKQAFETLYHHRYLPVFHFIKRLVIDQQAAEDITTETFLKVWQKHRDFANLAKFDSFLFTVARRASLNYIRDERRHSQKKRLLFAVGPAEQPDLAEQEISVRVFQFIYQEIAKLPANMQSVLRLHLEGMKNEAIAERLGLAEKTVRNLKTEAIKALRLRLSHTEFALLQLLLLSIHHGIC
jgi:RNA polymerase sigma factor (sigma-70 family)